MGSEMCIRDRYLLENKLTKSTMKLVDEDEFKKLLSTLKIEKNVSGGSVANSIVGLSQLDNNVGFIGKINDDDLGQKYEEGLIKENVKIILSYTHKPNIYSSIVGGLRGIRVLPNISGLGAPFISQNIVTKVIKLLYKFSLKYSFKVFFQNFEDLDLFVSLGLIHKDKAERIPGSGVNVKYFSQEKSKSKKTGTFIFLMMSRILWDKGVGEYIKAARLIKIKYPNVRFQLLGFLDVENPKAISRSKVNDWVEEGVVDYIGKTNDVKKFIQEVDCVVLPSYREGLPRSLLEAASLEIPIIATDVPGCRDVVENEVTGFLCDVKNPDHLAKKMELMIDLTSLERSKMGTYGREKIIKEFDEEIVIKAYLNALLIE